MLNDASTFGISMGIVAGMFLGAYIHERHGWGQIWFVAVFVGVFRLLDVLYGFEAGVALAEWTLQAWEWIN